MAHLGSCHCGGVTFRLTAERVERTTCDCSLCVKKNAVMTKVPEDALEVLQSEDLLPLHDWNTHRAKHYFCRRCGIYVFHRKRAALDHFRVNVFCLDDFDPETLPCGQPTARTRRWFIPSRAPNGRDRERRACPADIDPNDSSSRPLPALKPPEGQRELGRPPHDVAV